LSITSKSFGCFHNDISLLKIKNIEGDLYAEYNGKKQKLSTSQKRLLREFEIELRSNHSGGCSTRNEYLLYITDRNSEYITVDYSCVWNGFEYLLSDLELLKENPID